MISSEKHILLKVIAASAFIIFFNWDSIFLTILLKVGGSSKTSWPKVAFGERANSGEV
jgi:hypothetical protein